MRVLFFLSILDDPADEAVAMEDGEVVVAVLPLLGGEVDLQLGLESKEVLDFLPVPEEVVEVGEEGHALVWGVAFRQ